MITIHASAVCRVRDGYTGQPLAGSALLCTLDGATAIRRSGWTWWPARAPRRWRSP